MPFSPLPKKFLELLLHLTEKNAVVLELGCGEGGGFSSLIKQNGLSFIGMDNNPLSKIMDVQVIGDALCPPFLESSVDLIIVSNLFRHLLPSKPDALFLEGWQGLLKPGGYLVLFEDEPGNLSPGVANYKKVQEFLAQLAGPGRGRLLPLAQFVELSKGIGKDNNWDVALECNEKVADAEAVLSFLAGHGGNVAPEVADLMNQIKRHGIAYGNYWWAQWEKTGENF